MVTYENTIPQLDKFDYNSLRWQPNRIVIVGKTGCGKTYQCKKIISTLEDVYDRVYLFLPTGLHGEYMDLAELDLDIRIVPIDHTDQIIMKIEDIKQERMNTVLDDVKGKKKFKDDKRWCLVFDNIMRKKLCDSDVFGNLFFAGRHLDLDLIFISQYAFKYLNNAHKENTSHFFLLKNNFTPASMIFYRQTINSGMSARLTYNMNGELLKSITKSIIGKYIVENERGCVVVDENANKLYYLQKNLS